MKHVYLSNNYHTIAQFCLIFHTLLYLCNGESASAVANT